MVKAKIKQKRNKTVHALGRINERKADPLLIVRGESRLEIVEEESGIFLYRLNEEGEIIADTWHLTLEEAKAQASFEYGVKEGDWS